MILFNFKGAMAMKASVIVTALFAAVWLVSGCDDGSADSKSGAAAADPLPAGLLVDKPPADAKDVAEVRNTAVDGQSVVVRGRIGGAVRPFVEGRAAFQLVDLGLTTCDKESPMDNCKTPWDYCCDEREDVLNKSLTVQVVGPTGQPLRAELNGVGGLKPMSEVAVRGTVKKSSDGKAVLLNATQVYVKQG
jgi:hypothetical protein